MKNRIISLLLALALILSCIPAAIAAEVEPSFSNGDVTLHSAAGPLSLPDETLDETLRPGLAPLGEPAELESKYADYGVEPLSQSEANQRPKATDKVTFIVEMETKPLMETYSTDDIAAQTASVMRYQEKQETSLEALKAALTESFGASENFGINFTYTVATTGVSVTTEYGNKAAIEAMPGVKRVYVAPMFDLPDDKVSETELTPSTGGSSLMIGADVLNTNGYTGIGTRIAILDTGILLTHPNFEDLPEEKLDDPLTREEIEGVWDNMNAGSRSAMLPGRAYYSTKIPFIFNYVSLNDNVDHSFVGSDHGTHVAGIAAGNKIESSEMVGVAPDAQLIVMQVFEQGGGAAWDTILAAMEDCIWLDVDAANLSLGAAAGFTDHDAQSAMNQVLMSFENTDIEVLIASGNDTNNAFQNLWGMNMSLAGNPDIGLAGTPSTYRSAFAVASIDNEYRTMFYFTVDGQNIGYDDTAISTYTKLFNNLKGQTLDYVMVPGTGTPADYADLDVTGKVAVVQRGITSFPEKQAAAQEAGAVACIIYNNVNEPFLMQINDGEGNIPCVSISKANGELMANSEVKTLTVCEEAATLRVERAASSFSSWGVTPDLKLKPEIAGVGGQVYSSTDPQISGSYYGTWDGTSMATPQVAGAAAIMKEYFREHYPQITDGQLRRVIANMMMSTAQVVMNGELPYSPRHQGSGLVDLVDGTTSGAYLSSRDAYENRPKGEMGDDPERTGEYEFNFEINNISDKALTYTFDSDVLTETLVNDMFIGNTATALEAKIVVTGAGVDYAPVSVLKYDFNADEKITTADAHVLLRDVTGAAPIATDNIRYAYRDVNGDGYVTRADADVIVAYCAEMEVDVDVLATFETAGESAEATVTVPAGETVELTASITLTGNDIAVVEKFPNGIYVEGYLYAISADENGVDLSMPFVGFYGDWSDAPLFDEASAEEASLYPTHVITYASTLLGTNPYISYGKAGNEYNAVSQNYPLAEIDFGQLRNAKRLVFTVTDKDTGTEYFKIEGANMAKTYYNAAYGMIVPTWVSINYGEVWDCKAPNGTKVTYKVEGWLDDGDDIVDDSFFFEFTIDNEYPRLLNDGDLQENVRTDENGHSYLELSMSDNHYIAAVIFVSPDGAIMGKYDVDNVPGETFTKEFNITGFGNDFSIILADYALNETEIDVSLNLGAGNLYRPEPQELDQGRLYGNETFGGGLLDGGWFSANKADLSDPRNETFDSTKRYYAAEFVNGYIVGQNAGTGHLELIVPSGTYWPTQIIRENNGQIGDYNVWLLYDMAMDYSTAPDTLYAVGWLYKGDSNNDSKDDGHNALFKIDFSDIESVEVEHVARIIVDDGVDLLTLGITTEGAAYGIDTNARFYSVDLEPTYDETLNEYVITPEYISTTDFVNVANYVGANVIQSMGYDHNDGVMYWYAHSEKPNGLTNINTNVTYKIDLETGRCTEVGTYGPAGQTSLFVPHDITSDLFEMDVEPIGLGFRPAAISLVAGQTEELEIFWKPWNAKPVEVTWSSADESIATVDEYGFVTAHREGQVAIRATAQVQTGEAFAECLVTVLPAEDGLYGYVVGEFAGNSQPNAWITYSESDPTNATTLGNASLWGGGAYVDGYVYTTTEVTGLIDPADPSTPAIGTAVYRTKVNKGETPQQTTFGSPERVGTADNPSFVVSCMAFDYTTGRLYAAENNYKGGLVIVDTDTGEFDYLGVYNGDLGAAYTTAMCVTADGTIVVADMWSNLFTVNPDTMEAKLLWFSGNVQRQFYGAMFYNYNTDCIYWNPCGGAGNSPLFKVVLETDASGEKIATVHEMGSVHNRNGVQQTVMFAIPDVEPEIVHIPVESIEIADGETLTGIAGSTRQLTAVTTPARPTIRAKTWTSSNESVVTVDKNGLLTLRGVGTATVTVSITNKDEATHGGPFTDSIEVNVIESAGEFNAFLTSDNINTGGTGYYDFWLRFNDYDLRHASPYQSMISVLSLRSGTYFDGHYYGYDDRGRFLRISVENPTAVTPVGNVNLDTEVNQVTALAMDYTTGVMYGLTLPADHEYRTSEATPVQQVGQLVRVDLSTGAVTKVADLDFNTPVYALACDGEGQLYAAGGYMDKYADTTNIYKLDKETGALTQYTTIDGAGVYTGPNYLGAMQYNTQMTYDFTTDRLYLYATTDHQDYSDSFGMYIVQLGEEPTHGYIDGISLFTTAGRATKYGKVYLGMLVTIPDPSELPVSGVSAVILNKNYGRVTVGGTNQITAQVSPADAEDPSLTWSSSDESVATVDQNGLVTGVKVGTATITATSNQSGVSASCEMTVMELAGEQSVAYTVSATRDALITFNPAMPAQTAETVASFSGGANIVGVTYGDNCLYYVINTGDAFPALYQYDLVSKTSNKLAEDLYAWLGPQNDIAYDAKNNMIYVVAGFYIFQFDMTQLHNNGPVMYATYLQDEEYITHYAAEVVDGALYIVGSTYYTQELCLVKYSDVYLRDRTVVKRGLDLAMAETKNEMAYDSKTGMFYITDSGDKLYTMTLDGTLRMVDILGDGIDMNGLAIAGAPADPVEPPAPPAPSNTSVAYTISADNALVTFDPANPSANVETVATLNDATEIIGITMVDNKLYYLAYAGSAFPTLYLYDLTTQENTEIGDLSVYSGPAADIAYDAKNELLYVASGMTIYQFDFAKVIAGESVMPVQFYDAGYLDHFAIEVVDGALYAVVGNYDYTEGKAGSTQTLVKYSDSNLNDRTVVNNALDLEVAMTIEMSYDASAGLFYITNSSDKLYTMKLDGTLTEVGVLGSGLAVNGLAIVNKAN